MTTSQEHEKKETIEKQVTLEEARLQIGDSVSLQTQTEGAAERHSVRLIGVTQGRSILVTTPIIDGKYLLMREGQTFILRVFSGKSVFAFTTQILKSVNSPYPYLHLAYPREVKSLVVRKGARANVRVICAITGCDDVSIQEAGVITNISIGGALMGVKRAFAQKGQRLTIKFKAMVNGIDFIQEHQALIQTVNASLSNETDTPLQFGLQFVDVSDGNMISLLAFVYYQLLEQSPG